MTSEVRVTRALARFVVQHRWTDLPESIRHEGKRSLLNGLAAGLGACDRPEMVQGLAALEAGGVHGDARVIGRVERLDMLGAAFMNGVAINALDFDDTHMPTVIHPTAPVAPAFLALAERHAVTGAEALHAFVLGVEIACRLGNALHPEHYAHGFHITATCGVIGAAVCAGRLLRLDEPQMAHAIGLAATQAGGLVESLPTMAKSANVGGAARNGLFAAHLAAVGWDAPERAIEGRFGFARVLGVECAPAVILGGLGERWEILANEYKPYPSGVVLHPVIDAVLDLRAGGLRPEAVEAVTVEGSRLLGERADRGVVSTGHLAKLSIHHAVAIAFLRSQVGVAEFTDAAATDPQVQALATRTRFVEVPSMGPGSVRVKAVTRDGNLHEALIPHARGSAARPLTDEEIERKLALLTAEKAPWCDVGCVARTVWAIDTLDAASRVMTLLVPR